MSRDKQAELFLLEYKNNVHVKFADGTTIDSNSLKVLMRKKSKNSVEKIVFKKDVSLKRVAGAQAQDLNADLVELFPEKKLCTLTGNVKVVQHDPKSDKKIIPFATTAHRAQFFWESEQIELEGGEDEPVSTVIKLEGKLKTAKKEKKKRKKKRKK